MSKYTKFIEMQKAFHLEALRGGAQSFHAQLCTFPTRRRWADRGCHELCVTSRLGDHASIQYSTPFPFSTSFCHRSQSLALSSCVSQYSSLLLHLSRSLSFRTAARPEGTRQRQLSRNRVVSTHQPNQRLLASKHTWLKSSVK